MTFKYNFMDVYWELSDNPEYKKENIFYSQTWDHSKEVLPMHRTKNEYNI
jgi:hypothetical protein